MLGDPRAWTSRQRLLPGPSPGIVLWPLDSAELDGVGPAEVRWQAGSSVPA